MFQGVKLQSTVQPVISSHGGLGLGLVSHFIGVSGFKVTGLDCTTYIIQPRQGCSVEDLYNKKIFF